MSSHTQVPTVVLPSGAKLMVQAAPFATAKALYHAILREMSLVRVSTKGDFEDMLKTAFCLGFSSPDIENCLWHCFERCTYNGLKIDGDTFEPLAHRADYTNVCVEVTKANVYPFVKSLFAQFSELVGQAENFLGSKPKKTT